MMRIGVKITVDIEHFSFEAQVEKLEGGLIKANDNIMPSADFVVWLGDTMLGLLDKESSNES
jgi:hypothetical protein